MKRINPEIEKVRKILWEEYDEIIPDETVELMIDSFRILAKIFIKNLDKKGKI